MKKEVNTMGILKTLFKNRLFLIGLLIPLVWQVVYFSIAVPSVNDTDTRMVNLKVVIVNEDPVMGSQIAAQLSQVLPFTTATEADVAKALEDMDKGESNMVIRIPAGFTAQLEEQGSAAITYYINQAVPSMTKQIMETAAGNINNVLNENVFNNIKTIIQQHAGEAVGQSGLPPAAVQQISSLLGKVFSGLKNMPVTGDVQKVNNAEGTVKTVLPLFIFLTFFIGGVIYAVTHSLAYKSISPQISKGKLFLTSLIINIVYSLIVPFIVASFAGGFNITFSEGIFIMWLLLSAGFFTFVSLFQMLFKWLGIIGTGAFVLILFPLQLISSGFMFPTEILPSFYRVVADYLPATYFSSGVLKATYGGASVSGDIWILLLMSAIFIVISAFALLKRSGTKQNIAA
jgi:uncharacterized phage infection (PIP) family protein YhgE